MSEPGFNYQHPINLSVGLPTTKRSLSPVDLLPPAPSPGSEMSGSEAVIQYQQQQHQTDDGQQLRQNSVSTVVLHGIPIVSLVIDSKERLCLAQISNTLLKQFSYNEIHNRRVALGITCVQCTPVQLEILRRAGAMPVSSRRCGMITKREAERLVKSFLEDAIPPKLPDNFAFPVRHSCGWGCKGNFVPHRYNSSRAKCIKCTFCNIFFSPNKFIFHFHRNESSKYQHPDAANFNSWRRHLHLDIANAPEEIVFAWEDVKAMFNGGSRKKVNGMSCDIGSPCRSPPLRDSEHEAIKRPRLEDSEPPSPHKIPGLSYPFPVLPMSSPPLAYPPNMSSFISRPTHPAFPNMNQNEAHSVFPHPPKNPADFTELWKNKMGPYCNPLGFLWAKNFGFYGNDGCPTYRNALDLARQHPKMIENRKMNRSNVEAQDRMRIAEGGTWLDSKPSMHRKLSETRYNSAFKPVPNKDLVLSNPRDDSYLEMSEPSILKFNRTNLRDSETMPSPTPSDTSLAFDSDQPREAEINVTDLDNIVGKRQPFETPISQEMEVRKSKSDQNEVINLSNYLSTEVQANQMKPENTGEQSTLADNDSEFPDPSSSSALATSSEEVSMKYLRKENLQKELNEMMEDRIKAEKEYMIVQEALTSLTAQSESDDKSDPAYGSDLHLSVQQRLKDAREALRAFSSKMTAFEEKFKEENNFPSK